MRKITIYQKELPKVDLYDKTECDMTEYCKELSNLLKSSNVTIIETTESTFVVRPSQICGINVVDIKTESNDPELPTSIEETQKSIEEIYEKDDVIEDDVISEDIITDMDD